MKKETMMYWLLAAALFGAGAYGIFHLPAFWPVLPLFLGCALFAFPVGLPAEDRREIFSAPILWRERGADEPLLVARLFLAMAWVARHEGILALESIIQSDIYDHPSYRIGMGMIIDGYDPEFVKQSLRSSPNNIQDWCRTRCHDYKQVGAFLLFVGLFGGVSGALFHVARYGSGQAVSAESVCLTAFLTFLLLMGGLAAFLLLPWRLLGQCRREQSIQRQIIFGLQGLQQGNSPTAIAEEQITFLRKSQRTALAEMPVPEALRDKEMRKDSFEKAVVDLRDSLRYIKG